MTPAGVGAAEDGVSGDEHLGAVLAEALEVLEVDAAVDFDERPKAPFLDPGGGGGGSARGKPR